MSGNDEVAILQEKLGGLERHRGLLVVPPLLTRLVDEHDAVAGRGGVHALAGSSRIGLMAAQRDDPAQDVGPPPRC
jgi:hypothetical protein